MPRRAAVSFSAVSSPLHDVLIRAPVPQADDRRREDHAGPRELGVVGGQEQVEVGGAGRLDEPAPPADSRQADDGDGDRPGDQHHGLQRLGIHDGTQPADHGVGTGQQHHEQRPGPEVDRHQRLKHHRPRVNGHRDLGQHVGDERGERQKPAGRWAVPHLQELRHGEHAAAHVEGHEHPAEQQYEPGMQLVVTHHHATVGGRAGETDDVLRADVGSEDRGADDEPAHMTAGQEVVGGRLRLLAHDPRRDTEKHRKINTDDDPVECSENGHRLSNKR